LKIEIEEVDLDNTEMTLKCRDFHNIEEEAIFKEVEVLLEVDL
jgi:hypothetical protein